MTDDMRQRGLRLLYEMRKSDWEIPHMVARHAGIDPGTDELDHYVNFLVELRYLQEREGKSGMYVITRRGHKALREWEESPDYP